MSSMNLSFLLLSLFFCLPVFSATCASNIWLAETCCPTQSLLVSTCGDGQCEVALGENPMNCPFDCGNPLTRPISWTPFTTQCEASFVYYPMSLDDIRTGLKQTILSNEELRIWGTGHSSSPELCSEGGYMVLRFLNQIIGIEEYNGDEVVNVQPGVTFSVLNEYLFNNSKALGYAMPGYGEISVGGFVANDGHGSNGGVEGSHFVALVRSIDKMDQRGRVTTYSKSCTDHKEWRALMSDQGLLGITVGLRIKIRNAFNIKSRILAYTNEEIFKAGGMKAIADECQNYMFFDWFRSYQQAFVTCGTETSEPVSSPDAWNRLFVPQVPLDQLLAYTNNLQVASCDASMGYFLESTKGFQSSLKNWIEYTSNGQVVLADNGVGYSHKMIEVTLNDYVSHGIPGIAPVRLFEVSIPESMIDAAMAFIKTVCDENNLSFPLVGLIVRLGRYNDDSWLGHSAIDEDESILGERIYYIEAERYYPYEFTDAQYEAFDAPIVMMYENLVKNFKGKLHSGKNLGTIWSSQEVKDRYSYAVGQYQQYVEDFDPFGVFSNELAGGLGVTWPHKNEKFSTFYYYK